MTPGWERQQRYRERRREAGTRPVDVWLDAGAQAHIGELQQPGEGLEALVGWALHARKSVIGNGASPISDTDTLLLTFLQLFFPEGRPVFPRRAYGLRTLPLSTLNTFLTGHGYVLHASKVRNADWFVACTDQAGQTDTFGLFKLQRVARS